MALRIPKRLTDLSDVPSPVEGQVLRWEGGAPANYRPTLSDLGIYVGQTQPSDPITYEEWMAGIEGHFGWLQVAAGIISWSGVSPGASMALTAVAPLVSVSAVATSPGAAMSLTAVAPTVTVSNSTSVTVTSPGASMELTAVAPTVSVAGDQHFTSPGASMALTAVAPLVSVSAVKTSPGASMVFTAVAPTVTAVDGSSALLVDAFTGTNGAAPDASKWGSYITASGGAISIQSNKLRFGGSSASGWKFAGIKSVGTFTAVSGRIIKATLTHYSGSTAFQPVLVLFGTNGTNKTVGIAGDRDSETGEYLGTSRVDVGVLDSSMSFATLTGLSPAGADGAAVAVEFHFTSATNLQIWWGGSSKGSITLPSLGGSFYLGFGAQWVSGGGTEYDYVDTVEVD